VRRTIGAVCWLLGIEWFAGQAIAQAAWRTPYRLSGNLVDDLGAVHCGPTRLPGLVAYVCSPLHDMMNVSFVLLGLLTIAGTLLLWDMWPRRRLATLGLSYLMLFGIGTVAVGLAPEDVDIAVHGEGFVGSLIGSAGILILGLASLRTLGWRAAASILVGTAGFTGFVLLITAPGLGVGTMERLAEYPLPIWLAVLGAVELTAARRRQTGRAETVTKDSVGIDPTSLTRDD